LGVYLFLPCCEIARGEISRADAFQRSSKLWWRSRWRQCDWRDDHGWQHDQFGLRPETEMRQPVTKQHLSFLAASVICFFALNATADAQQVKADTGGIAIGGSVSGSTINIGIPQEKVDALVRDAKRPLEELTTQQRENIALLKEKLDLNERQVRAALGVLGENDIPPERLAAKLVEIAENFKVLKATASAQPGDDPKIVDLKTDAQKAIEAGELAKADALLANVEAEQRRGLDRLAVNAAETSAQRGEIALTRLRYAEAAKHFASAAAVFPPNGVHEDKRISYLQKEAGALYQQGYELGDNDAFLSAIERCKQLVELTTRKHVPLEWGKHQKRLGVVLMGLGERESGTAKLEQALVAYREALKELTRERVPLDWAITQSSLGWALFRIGEHERNTAKFEDAVAVYRQALKEQTRETVPLDWANTQNRLGAALARLGMRERGTARLEEAVIAFREALKERTRERVALGWATSQNNLGLVLLALGERESGRARLEEAMAAFREALKEQTRERVPLQWAQTQNNLGIVLQALGRRESGTAKLEEAVVAYREALKERTRERVPLDWATTQTNLGNALRSLGEREGSTARFEEALAAYLEALKERTRERVPLAWAETQHGLGNVFQALGRGESGTAKFEEAIIVYREALKEWTRERVPLHWAMAQYNLGIALADLGKRESGTAKLEEAVLAYREALKERTRERVLLDWASSFGNEGIALMLLAERRGDAAMGEIALSQINAAFEALRAGGNAPSAAYYERLLPRARAIVARLRGQ
jgi:tetratricopeptide (TPR) repeat protein